jgi:hypothetical protein
VCSHLFCGHKGFSLPEVSVTSFLLLHFFVLFAFKCADFFGTLINVIIIIIIIRLELRLHRPVSAYSSSLFKGLPSRLRPFGL